VFVLPEAADVIPKAAPFHGEEFLSYVDGPMAPVLPKGSRAPCEAMRSTPKRGRAGGRGCTPGRRGCSSSSTSRW
jgi:hypothetical protein